MSKVIAFIPMRSGSKGIPDKNITEVKGFPLFAYAVNKLIVSNKVDKVVIATDSKRYKKIIGEFFNGSDKLFFYNRSKENAKDDSTTEDVILEFLKDEKCDPDDLLLLCQVTNPFTQILDVEGIIDLVQNQGYDTALTGVDMTGRFIWNRFNAQGFYQAKGVNYNYTDRPRRQDIANPSEFFVENGALYISSVARILKHKNRLSGKIGIWVMEPQSIFEIDEPDDLKIVRKLL